MIELKNIQKTFYKGTDHELRALNDINLEIGEKEFVIIIGANGSGKSTLLNILSGTVFPDSGNILIDQKEITWIKEYNRSKWISRIFQNPLLGTAPELTVLENFRLASLRTKSKRFFIGTGDLFRKAIRERISVLNLGLENQLDRTMGSLSGGQRQALALLMTAMDDSKILLLDEPSAALDPRTSVLVMNLANQIITTLQLTAILITHQPKDLIEYGNRVIQLREGRIQRDLKGFEKKQIQPNDVYNWFQE